MTQVGGFNDDDLEGTGIGNSEQTPDFNGKDPGFNDDAFECHESKAKSKMPEASAEAVSPLFQLDPDREEADEINGEVDTEGEASEPVKTETMSDGTRIEQWLYRRDRLDDDGALISRYLLTTVGRVVINHTIIDAVAAT